MNRVTRNKLSHHALSLAIGGALSLAATAALAADADRQVADGTVITVPAGSIDTTGDYAHALEAINGGTISATDTDLATHGYRAQGIFADGAGSAVTLTGGSITVDGTDSGGGLARNGAALVVDGTNINVSGNGVHGLAAFAGGQVTARNTHIESTGQGDHGVDARDAGSRLEISDSTIHTTGNNASGMFANLGGQLSADRVDVHTEGNTSYGVLIGSGTLEMRDSTIRTDGDYASGVIGKIGAQIGLRNSSITTAGNFNAGVHADGEATIKADGVEISTAGTTAVGVLASGADASIIFNGGRIQTAGVNSDGARVSNDGHLEIGRDAGGNGTLIQISGDNARGAWIDKGTARIDGATIEINGGRGTGIVGAAGVVTSHGGDAQVTNTTINTTGFWADGVDVEGDSSMTVANSSIHTTGNNAKGAVAYDGNASLVLDNVSIRTEGATARGVVASGVATNVSMTGGSITTTGASSKGAQAISGAALQLGQVSIDASGTGVQASGDSRVDMSNVTVLTHEGYAHGIEATGNGATVTGSNVRSTTEGEHAYGLRANDGGSVELDAVTVNTKGAYAHGAVADTAGSRLKTSNTNITTTGDVGMGARAFDGGIVDIADASVTTYGNGSYGLDSMTGGSVLNADNVRVETFGTSFGGTTASAVVAEWGGQVNISNADIVTHGVSSIGLLSQVGGSAGDPDTVLNAHKVQVMTSGENAFGAMACSLVVGAGDACASPIHSGTAADGARAMLNITDSSIQTTGVGSHGLYAYGPAGAALVATGSQVLTTGDGAHGTVAEFGADLQLVNSQVRAEGVGAVGADVIGSTLGMAGGSLFSVQDSAIRSAGGDITLTAAAQISAGNGVFVEQIGDDASIVRMHDDVIAAGDIVFGAGATTGATTLQLSNGSAWIGKTAGVIDDLSIASGSRWQMTGDSEVGQLRLDHGIVAFDPTTTGTFKTLTVNGDFEADNGLLLMNTALGDDNSGTDKLHVLGNTSGTAGVAVNNLGGLGAETQDGIQIIEVDGRSDARFDLSGRAVAGQYEYFLYQGGKNDPNDGDWYLRSEMSPVDPGTDPGTDPVIDPPAPVQRPEGGAYLANQAAAVGMFDLTLHERVGEPNLAERQRSGNNLGSVWVRTTSDHPHYRINDQLAGQGRQSVLQIGTDLTHWGSEDRGVLGVMAANGQSRSQVTSDLTGYSAQGRVDGRAVGVYATWIQGAKNDGGLYVDSWLQAARFKNSVQGDALAQENYRSRSTAASLEAGYAMRLTNNENSAVYLEPQVQAIWTDYRMESGNHQEVNGTVVSKGDAGGLQTRVGARLYGHATAETGNRVQPFVAVNWIRNPSHANSVWMDQTLLEGVMPRDVYEAKAGVQLQLSPRLTGWGELNTQRGAYGFSSMGAQMGVKYAW
jgi:autotransporter family porin